MTFGLSFAHRGRAAARAAVIAAAVASGEWANTSRRASTLGQLRFTSTATTHGGAPASIAAALA